MVNLRTLFTLRMGKERPSLGEGRSTDKQSLFRKDRKGVDEQTTEEPRNSTLLSSIEGNLFYFAEYDAKNTNSRIVQ
jgi:hypothetical protein